MEEKPPVPDYDSDSSDGLPELCPKIAAFDTLKLKKNDIVWAEYKGFYWPAIVRSVDKKNRKVHIWYLDSPGKSFKLPFKKIHDFMDSSFRKNVVNEAKMQPFGQKHAQVLTRIEMFCFRKIHGCIDDPLEFFDTSRPYFALKDIDSAMAKMQCNNENASAEKVEDKKDDLKESSENESEGDVEVSPPPKYLPELHEENNLYDDEMVDKIISCITSGDVDNYLMDIVNSKIANERHKMYVEAVKKDQMDRFWVSYPSIPIQNQKLHTLSIYLNGLYEQKINKGKPRINQYIISVWLPEAVNKAVLLIEENSSKVPDVSCSGYKPMLPLEAEASDMTVDLGNGKFSSSPILAESFEVLDSCNNNMCSAFQESPLDASDSNARCVKKRKGNNSNVLENKASASTKKKFTGRKGRRGQSRALKSRKKSDKDLLARGFRK